MGTLHELPERLTGHIHTAEGFESRRVPPLHSTIQHFHLCVARATQTRLRAQGNAVSLIAQADAHVAARYETVDLELEAAIRQRDREENVTLAELPRLAHVKQRKLAPAAQQACKFLGADQRIAGSVC